LKSDQQSLDEMKMSLSIKTIEGLVCEKQDAPSMQEIPHSLIPKFQMLIPIIFEKLSHKNPLNHC
jgi:hypothetical protein